MKRLKSKLAKGAYSNRHTFRFKVEGGEVIEAPAETPSESAAVSAQDDAKPNPFLRSDFLGVVDFLTGAAPKPKED
jgi:hypothetical protein